MFDTNAGGPEHTAVRPLETRRSSERAPGSGRLRGVERTKRRRVRAVSVWVVWTLRSALLCVLLLAPRLSHTELTQDQLEPFALAPGLTIFFDTTQLVPFQSNYWTRIEIVDVSRASVEFDFEMFGGAFPMSSGSSVILDRQGCTELNPWWGPGRAEQSKRCELWLSTDGFESLRLQQSLRMAVDVNHRADPLLELTFLRQDRMQVEIDGRLIELDVVVLSSSLGDELWVYDRADNPFVLKSRVLGVYEWFVSQVFIELEPPPNDAF